MKKFALICLSLVLILIAGVTVFIINLDLNRYKDLITQTITTQTGLQTSIKGDIEWSLLPDFGIIVKNIELHGTAKQLPENVVTFNASQFLLKFKLASLFQDHLVFHSIKLTAPSLTVSHNTAQSTPQLTDSSLPENDTDDTLQESTQAPQDPPLELTHQKDAPYPLITIYDISLEKGALTYTKDGSTISLTNLNTQLSFNNNTAPFSLETDIVLSNNAQHHISLEGVLNIKQKEYVVDQLNILLDKVSSYGTITVDLRSSRPDVNISLNLDTLNLESLICCSKNKQSSANTPVNQSTAVLESSRQPTFQWDTSAFDLTGLGKINTHINLQADKLRYKNLTVIDPSINAHLRHGRLTVKTEATIDDGAIKAQAVVDITNIQPKFSLSGNISSLDTSLLNQLIQNNKLHGTIDSNFELTSYGQNQLDVIKHLSGTISVDIAKGRIIGVDLIRMVQNIADAFNVGTKTKALTEFEHAHAMFVIDNGIAYNDDLSIVTSALTFTGMGEISLWQLLVNYRLSSTFEAGAFKRSDLDVRIPVIIRGYLLKPEFIPDFIQPLTTFMKDPKKTKNLIRELKDDFKNMRGNINEKKSGLLNELFQ